MRLSLRYRLLLVPFVLLIVTVLATGYAALHAARSADERIQERIRAIVRTLRGPPMFVLSGPVLMQLKNLTGAEFEVDTLQTFARNAAPPIVRKARENTVLIDSEPYSAHRVELAPPHPNANALVMIYFPESIRRQEMQEAVRPVLVLGLGGGLIASILSILVGQWLIRRIHTIEAGTRAIAAGQFSPLPLPATNDELRDLVLSVNDMAMKLSAGAETLKQNERLRVLGQVSGGLAHQLRNAAAGARLAIQLANDDPADREPLAVALRQLQRMESILRQFLDLGRPEERPRVPCDLRDAIDRAITLVQPQARHTGTSVDWMRPAVEIIKPIDAGQFEHLLENLLTNAVEAAGPGGSIQVTLNSDRIEVIDSGPGPADEIAGSLFEPFATAKPGGIGLGLMVAKQVAEAHGATLAWSRRDGQTVFAVEFVT